jgi:hypothetical protein
VTRRPKYYDRPGYRPGPERTAQGGGSIIDQRGQQDERDQVREWADAEMLRRFGSPLPTITAGRRPGDPIPVVRDPRKESDQ